MKSALFIELCPGILEYIQRVVNAETAILVQSPQKRQRVARSIEKGISEWTRKDGKTYVRVRRASDRAIKYFKYEGENEYEDALLKARQFFSAEIDNEGDAEGDSEDSNDVV